MIVEEEIATSEILVRYVFLDNFKKKKVAEGKIISKHLFGPLRGGTSLQRERYCNEECCVALGNEVPNKILVGFLVFTKQDFERTKTDFIASVENKGDGDILDAYIKASPLDENFNVMDFSSMKVTIHSKGNPAHADIIYLKPKLIPEDVSIYERPNTVIRSFSKKMYLASNLILNESEDRAVYKGPKFKQFY